MFFKLIWLTGGKVLLIKCCVFDLYAVPAVPKVLNWFQKSKVSTSFKQICFNEPSESGLGKIRFKKSGFHRFFLGLRGFYWIF